MPEREHTRRFTGYREYKLPWGGEFENHPRCRKLQQQIFDAVDAVDARRHPPLYPRAWPTAATCIFFDAARYLRLSHPEVTIEAAIPYSGQADRWRPELRARYDYDLRQCDYQTLVQEAYTPGCTTRRNRYMVDASRILIAAFDGSSRRHGAHARIRRAAKARDHPAADRPRAGRDMIYTKKHGERFFVLPCSFFAEMLTGLDLFDVIFVA